MKTFEGLAWSHRYAYEGNAVNPRSTAIVWLAFTAISAAVTGTFACSPMKEESHVPTIRMTEALAVPIPEAFPVSNAWTQGNGEVYLLSSTRPHVIAYRNSRLENLGQHYLLRPIGIAAGRLPGSVAVVDGDRRTIVTMQEGRIVFEEAWDLPARAEAAVRTSAAWFIMGRDSLDDFVLFKLDPDRGGLPIYRVGRRAQKGRTALLPHLGKAGANVIVTSPEPPFRTVVVSPEGGLLRRFESIAASHFGADSGERQQWVAVATVQIADVYVQTLADLRSDRRELLVFDKDGRFVRRSTIHVPIGLGSTEAEGNFLLGVRRIPMQEVVLYRWHLEGDSQ